MFAEMSAISRNATFESTSLPITSIDFKNMEIAQLAKLSLQSNETAMQLKMANIHLEEFTVGMGNYYENSVRIGISNSSGRFFCSIVTEMSGKNDDAFFKLETLSGTLFEKCTMNGYLLKVFAPSRENVPFLFSALYSHFSFIFPKVEQSEFCIDGTFSDVVSAMFSMENRVFVKTVKLYGIWTDAAIFDKVFEFFEARNWNIQDFPPNDSRIEKLTGDYVYFDLRSYWLNADRIRKIHVKKIVLEKNTTEAEWFNLAVKQWSWGDGFEQLEMLEIRVIDSKDELVINKDLNFREWDMKKRPSYYSECYLESDVFGHLYDLRKENDIENPDKLLATLFKSQDKYKFVVWTKANFENVREASCKIEKKKNNFLEDIEKETRSLANIRSEVTSLKTVLQQLKNGKLETEQEKKLEINELENYIQSLKDEWESLSRHVDSMKRTVVDLEENLKFINDFGTI